MIVVIALDSSSSSILQAAGGLWKDLQETLCSLSFIYVKFQAGLGSQLLEDFLANGTYSAYFFISVLRHFHRLSLCNSGFFLLHFLSSLAVTALLGSNGRIFLPTILNFWMDFLHVSVNDIKMLCKHTY